jgi:hypothetical protein
MPPDDDEPNDPRTRSTLELDPMDVHSWPIVLAGLDRLGDWEPVYALRLGLLTLVKETVNLMCERDAPADLVNRLRLLAETLAHLPWR